MNCLPAPRIVCLLLLVASCSAPATTLAGESPIYFRTDIVPILTKLGCNSGGCHGKADGQNGFKLSLLGFEPELDYLALAKQARGRRLFPAAPEQSLLLRKGAGESPHGGGQRMQRESEDYRILRDWIKAGAPPPRESDPSLVRISLSPKRAIVKVKSQSRLQVLAHFSDGSTRDVTQRAVYESNEPEIASVSTDGLVKTLSQTGLFSVMVRYGDQLATFHAVVPLQLDVSQREKRQQRFAELDSQLAAPIDRLLLAQWKRLGIEPSSEVSEAKFVRRATLDICGTLPTRKEVESYLADSRSDKRRRLINRLLERPEYASYFALKWAAILQNRGAGYSTRQQRAGTALLSSWIRDSLADNKPYDQFVREIITASGSQNENPPTVWYRRVRTQVDYVESVSQAFLGVRVQCAQCHHHPFERWSQADYYGLAAVFAKVGRKGGFSDAEVPTNEVIFVKDQGEVRHPRSGQRMTPKALGGPEFQLSRYDDPRQSFAHWMTAPSNPFFARTMVNRMWAHFHGRGIIHPIDDARSTNPPSNPELLAELTRDFIQSGYDIKQLVRRICNSYSYRLQSTPNATNGGDKQNFARFYPRRLPAEVLLDGISQVLDSPTQFGGGQGAFPQITRAIDLPDENVASAFLDVFGRPARTSACECERSDSPALAQALTLINSKEIQRKLTDKKGYAARLSANAGKQEQHVIDIFWRVFGRRATAGELQTSLEFLEGEEDQGEAYRSLLWSLLATNEFMFNH